MTLVGSGTAAVLVLVGVLHGVWMFSPWPLRTREEFASRVVGVPVEKLPTGPATGAVAVLLGVAAYVVAGRAGVLPVPGPGWLATAGAAGVAAVLLLRGAAGLVVSSRQDTEFARLDLRIYSPLCLVLAACCASVAALG
ncbi:DUF3995 domain-containing protein [Lentzea californiensis]|uniref:DUF3995 domain-containing protein n=1 Tax=Lentzea californiensis TaxID=438851 RepID=UPI0021657139|nr:DUF3995 domain-containing protein [Lentzea californiensis]MCR3750581.1 Protein of unknown function (DUF3995) [Lentzea californiensis]